MNFPQKPRTQLDETPDLGLKIQSIHIDLKYFTHNSLPPQQKLKGNV